MNHTSGFLLLSCMITWTFFHLLRRRRKLDQLPPGPHPFPIIGNIHQLGSMPHQSLTNLSQTHGPLMRLKLGNIDSIIVSSPEIAKQILQQHDQAFDGRMTSAATRALDHHRNSIACLPSGDQWRLLRKICKEQMFSTQRMDAGRGVRQEKVQKLVDHVQKCCVGRKVVDVGEAAFVTSLNLISNTLFSVDFADYEEGSSQELKETIHGLMGAFGSFNVVDYFPILGWLDPQGIKKKAEVYVGKLLGIFDGMIDERLKSLEEKNDLVEALLDMNMSQRNECGLSHNHIKHLLLDLFVAGTDTTSSTVEWVMTELIRNPKIMWKVKKELKNVIGEKRQVQESDISNLPYLEAVMKESMRYHPPAPFLARRKDQNDMKIDNFIIPKNALVLVNIWAIGRDSRTWRNPASFEPERFLDGEELDVKRHRFKLIPFGAGRRTCPGVPLAYRMVHLMVASLVHNFDWKVEQEVDINEKFGLLLHKALPLKALPIKPSHSH